MKNINVTLNIYISLNRAGLMNSVYVGMVNGDIFAYNFLNGTKTFEGKTINVSVGGSGQCIAISLTGNVYNIIDTTVCMGLGPWMCELGKEI